MPGVWRHGDWIAITERGSAVIQGRSDSTLNRQGVRMGRPTSTRVVERCPEIRDSLVIGLELPDGGYWMPLFVRPRRRGRARRRAARPDRTTRSARQLSPRHVPDEIIAVPAVPHTLTGKRLEVPVKRLFQGRALAEVAAPGATADPAALEWFAEFRRGTGRRGGVAGILPRWTHRPASVSSSRSTARIVGQEQRRGRRRAEVGYRFCDTGLLYRAVTWLALARNLSASYPHAVHGLVDEVELAPDEAGRLSRVLVDGIDHTDDVRSPAVDVAVSAVSAIPELRLALLDRQRALAARVAGSSWPGVTSGRSSCPTPTSRSISRRRSRSARGGGPRNASSIRRARRRRPSSKALRRRRRAQFEDGRSPPGPPDRARVPRSGGERAPRPMRRGRA